MNCFARSFVVLTILFAVVAGRAFGQTGSVPVSVDGAGFAVHDLRSGAEAYQNRKYVWLSVPPGMAGWKFTEVSGGVPARITVRPTRDGVLYVAAAEPPSDAGGPASSNWQMMPGWTLVSSDKKHTALHVYSRPCVADVPVAIPQAGWAGAIVLAPEISGTASVAVSAASVSAVLLPRDMRPPGVTIDYIPAETKAFVGSPTIAILSDGTYVVAHDIFGPGAPHGDVTKLFQSKDRGVTWEPLASIAGSTWASLFVHRGALYLLGPEHEFGRIVIRRSMDGGHTWTEPTGPETGRLSSDRGMSAAPTPVTLWRGRLWHAFEINPPGTKGRKFEAFLFSASEDADLLRADSWTRTAVLPYDKTDTGGNWLEGNAVVTPDGAMTDILRISKDGIEKAAMLHLTPDGRSLAWSPTQDRIGFPGGGVKFTIRYDPVSRRYWTLANKQRDPKALRNVLTLTSSADLVHWTVEATLLRHPDTKKHAFQYVDWLFDGDDIVAVSRTSWDGDTFHNANYLTFHRISDFRTAQRKIGP